MDPTREQIYLQKRSGNYETQAEYISGEEELESIQRKARMTRAFYDALIQNGFDASSALFLTSRLTKE